MHAFKVFWGASRPGTLALAGVVALALSTVFAVSMRASCGLPTTSGLGVALPQSQLLEAEAAMQQSSETDQESEADKEHASLVGLWKATLHSGGKVLFDAFEEWHSDGTEILNTNESPGPPNGTGGVCLGVYKKTGLRTYKSKHPVWIFDGSGTLVATLDIRERITVDKSGNTYRGSFSILRYDLDGNLIGRVDGTLTATRITPD
jgi:hypothetical protein